MSGPLATPRILLEAESQSAQFVLDGEPYASDMGYHMYTPSSVEATVEDSGIFDHRDGTNWINAKVEFDEMGRPLTEIMENGDRDETTIRQWYYEPLSNDFESRHSDGETEVVQAREELPDGSFLFSKNGTEFLLKRSLESDGTTTWVLQDVEGTVLERTAYDQDGKLSSVEYFGEDDKTSITRYHYNEHGLLVWEETTPGSLIVGSDNRPDVREYQYSAHHVDIRGEVSYDGQTFGYGIRNLTETRTYDDKQRPVTIEQESGVIDMGRHLVKMAVSYPEAG